MKTVKKYKTQIISLLVVLALGMAYVKREELMKFFGKEPALDPSPAPVKLPAVINTVVQRDKVLKYGDTGASVTELQDILNEQAKSVGGAAALELLEPDGIFGPKTEARLEKLAGVKSISINQLNAKFTA